MKRFLFLICFSFFNLFYFSGAQNYFPLKPGDKNIINIYSYKKTGGCVNYDNHVLNVSNITDTIINNELYILMRSKVLRYDSIANKLVINWSGVDKDGVNFYKTSGADSIFYKSSYGLNFQISTTTSFLSGQFRKIYKITYSWSWQDPTWGYPRTTGNYLFRFAEGLGEIEDYYYENSQSAPVNPPVIEISHKVLIGYEKQGNLIPTFNSPQVMATLPDEQSVVLSWNDPFNFENGFSVEKKMPNDTGFTVIALLPPDSLKYVDTTTYGTSYEYRVRIFRDEYYSYPDTFRINTIAYPYNLSSSLPDYLKVKLQWSYDSYTCPFIIERSVKVNGLYNNFAPIDTTNTNELEFVDSTVAPGDSYKYRVRALLFGLVSLPTNEVVAVPDFILLTPQQLTAQINEYESVKLTWVDPNQIENILFRIERKKIDAPAYQFVSLHDDTTYCDESIEENLTYIYRIRAVKGTKITVPAFSEPVYVPPFLPVLAPGFLYADSTVAGKVILSWQDLSTNEKQFDIGRGKTAASLVVIDSVPLNTITYEDLNPILTGDNKELYYAVRGRNPHSQSQWIVSSVISGIEDNTNKNFEYYLYQNYPNPFNPATIIRYDIPENSVVEISIYDVLGSRINTIVNNQIKQPGSYEILFDASNLSSGIYFYRVKANEYISTKKMIVIK